MNVQCDTSHLCSYNQRERDICCTLFLLFLLHWGQMFHLKWFSTWNVLYNYWSISMWIAYCVVGLLLVSYNQQGYFYAKKHLFLSRMTWIHSKCLTKSLKHIDLMVSTMPIIINIIARTFFWFTHHNILSVLFSIRSSDTYVSLRSGAQWLLESGEFRQLSQNVARQVKTSNNTAKDFGQDKRLPTTIRLGQLQV